ncbi:hypothetical protein Tco_0510590 [Tanacetum coccineum]
METIVYTDFDYVGDYVDLKSTSGVCTFMGCCLTSWFSKKQTALATSTTEAEYVSAGKACQQALWMKQALVDYDIKLNDIPILYDNKDAIDLIGQFCDANLEVGFSEIYVFCLRSSGNDLLPLIVDLTSITNPFKKQPHHSNLSWLNLTNSSMVMARRRSHLNFDYITAFKENIVIVLLNTEVFEGTTSSSCEMRMQTRSQSVQRLFQPSSKVD